MTFVRTGTVAALPSSHHPSASTLAVPGLGEAVAAAERELSERAASDPDRCCGYFPALIGRTGIVTELPACREFAEGLPEITHGGGRYRFNFLRLSLVQQGGEAAYHLDSDAATALTGDVASIHERLVSRLLLNLSSRADRTLRYLDVDPRSVDLVSQGAYVRAADPQPLMEHVVELVIPPRRGSVVRAAVFASNRVLHSGVDDDRGHFVAAYGAET
jgi:hypothetical protein